MQKITTHLVAVLFATLFFSACHKNEFDGPTADVECATVKDWTNSQGTRFLLNEYIYDADKLAKVNRFGLEGQKTESVVEYDNQSRILNITEKTTPSGNFPETQYVTTFQYYGNGNIYRIDNFKVENNTRSLVQTRILHYNNLNKVEKLVSSFGVHWRYEYNENGNVTKTYYKPADSKEFLQEEYTAYDDKLLVNTLESALIAQNISNSSTGINFSKNNVLACKIYNQDGSLNAAISIAREYNGAGEQTKITTTTSTKNNATSSTVDTEYPTCR